ncbi:MAG: DUF1838 family protein [Steroidobacteraceae bacterium]
MLASLASLATAAPAARADLLTPEARREGAEALAWSEKLTCGTTEAGVTRYGMWEGKLYSRAPGEKDRHVFNVIGINTRQCQHVTDPQRGEGFRSVSREIMVYLDPVTNEIIDTWKNPWTGETVDVIHVANDPVNMRRPTFATSEAGKPLVVSLRQYEDTLVASDEVPLFYTNPLTGDYQDYVGGQYHAMEVFNTYYRTADFVDAKKTRISDSRISWQRISAWLPWMRMGDRTGIMIFNATGFSTFEKRKIPPKLLQVLESRYPQYLVPPPLDDARPNETTWTVTRKWIDAKRAAAPKNAP